MNPVDFNGSNKVLRRPSNMTEDECTDLHVLCDGQTCYSEWELTPEELASVMLTKRIGLWVFSGATQPPVALGVAGSWTMVHPNYEDFTIEANKTYSIERNYGGRDVSQKSGVSAAELTSILGTRGWKVKS